MQNKNIVYSTDPDWQAKCNTCGENINVCVCKSKANTTTGKQKIYIERDRKQRKGKTVTVLSGMSGDLKKQLKEMQKLCGAGGSVKAGKIEIQGDHRDKIKIHLEQRGFIVIKRGG
jgi:translation initiation factor 1